MKFLFVATMARTINTFLTPHILMLKEQGHTVDICCNVNDPINSSIDDEKTKVFNIQFNRNPFKSNLLSQVKEVRRIIKSNDYDIIHTHTPTASAVCRVANIGINGTKMFYTAHGFHFYSGARLLNWLIYFPIEYILSKFTDTIITMNQEDYQRSLKFFKTSNNEVVHTNGVGINLDRFFRDYNFSKDEYFKDYQLNENNFILTYVGEQSFRKNQPFLIEAMEKLVQIDKNIILLLVGDGPQFLDHELLIKSKGLQNNVILLGQRKDVPEIFSVSDICVTSSRQEGLPVNIMEAMASGLPIVASNIRGNNDLVQEGKNGYLFELDNRHSFIDSVLKIKNDVTIYASFSKNSKEMVKQYSFYNILNELIIIYGL